METVCRDEQMVNLLLEDEWAEPKAMLRIHEVEAAIPREADQAQSEE
jgi:hypothetical protein